jgi:hypothetical protein
MVDKKAIIGKLFGDRLRRRRAMKGEISREKLIGYVIGLEWAIAVAGGIVVMGPACRGRPRAMAIHRHMDETSKDYNRGFARNPWGVL